MRVLIYVDEMYPEYQVHQSDNPNCDIPDELFSEYKRIMAEFDDMQQKLKRILNDSRVNDAKVALVRYVGPGDAERISGKFDPDTILCHISEFDKQAENIYNRSRDGVRPSDNDIAADKIRAVRDRILETFTSSRGIA